MEHIPLLVTVIVSALLFIRVEFKLKALSLTVNGFNNEIKSIRDHLVRIETLLSVLVTQRAALPENKNGQVYPQDELPSSHE